MQQKIYQFYHSQNKFEKRQGVRYRFMATQIRYTGHSGALWEDATVLLMSQCPARCRCEDLKVGQQQCCPVNKPLQRDQSWHQATTRQVRSHVSVGMKHCNNTRIATQP